MFEIVMWPVAKATSCVADAVSSAEPEEREHHTVKILSALLPVHGKYTVHAI